ncbi:MAG: BatD family protein [Chromatiaceae bacterium]|nr:BatD family protein [Chromatiaceae bacterium]
MTTIRLQTLLICLLALLLAGNAGAAGAEARLDRSRVGEGETVVLMLNVSGGGSGTPDLSPLMKDFDLVNQSQSMQMSMINGRSSSTRGWELVLAPKRTGKIDIPAINVGGATTRPLSLEVLPAAEAAKLGPAAPVLLEVEVAPKQAYVQQKVVYTVRLMSRAPLRQARLSEPRVKDAIVEPLGGEREYASQRDGQQYRVIERHYAIFPQHSGPLQIDGPLLSAEVPDPNQRSNGPGQRFPGRDPFADFDRMFGRSGLPGFGSMFGQTRPIQLRGRSIELDVQAQPPGTLSPWLPAESLTLNETWSADPPVFTVGEPITRTIAITAQGLSAAQLPEMQLAVPDGIKAYPDKSQSQARVDGDTLIAQKVLKLALVPSRSGALTLPEVTLAWWDTHANKEQLARLPARRVEVLPAPAGSAPAADTAAPSAALPAQARPMAARSGLVDDALNAVPANRDEGTAAAGYWPWIAALLALAWMATLGLWLRSRGRRQARQVAAAAAPRPASPDPAAALTQLEQACRDNDPAAARRALLAWAAARWPEDPPQRLDVLAQRLGEQAMPLLADLDQRLYSDAGQPWDGMATWARLSPLLHARKSRASRHDSSLPPLYPQNV